MDKTEELEERREKRLAEREKAKNAQYAIDLEAREQLEDEFGELAAVRVAFVPGQPTRALLKAPTPAQYKRYVDQIQKAIDKKNTRSQREAQELLARACWVYPREEADRDAMLERYPGLLLSIALAAAKLAEGKAEEEGKD